MDIFDLLKMLGGLATFLFGMYVMGNGLEKAAGGGLERTLERLTNSKLRGVLLGASVTAIIQSSAATTIMVVGFVNSGIMRLGQAIGVIMGANIGTTATAWLLSLVGIEGSSVAVQLLKPESFSPVLAIVGVCMIMFCKRDKRRDAGSIMIGFALLMLGMSSMTAALKPLAEVPAFTEILTAFSNPLLGVLAGAVMTALVQSSSATVGVLQALSATGGVSFGTAIPIIMGQNIGSCVTALISCAGASKNAKRAAMVHLYFNIIGTVLFLVLFYVANAVFRFSFVTQSVDAVGIAVIHTTFNILATAVLLPFSNLLAKLATLSIRDGAKGDSDIPILDERFLNTPSFAVEQCRKATVKMAQLARRSMLDAIANLGDYSDAQDNVIKENEDTLDKYEDALGSYLVKLSQRELSESDSNEISKLLHTIGNFERIGDHALNISESAKEMHEKEICFSQHATEELGVMAAALTEILTLSVDAFAENDLDRAARVEPLEQVIDDLNVGIKDRHIARLKRGECTIELGFVLADVLGNFERVSDHCSNIAVCVIQINENSFDTHSYLNDVKTSGKTDYMEVFADYRDKYLLPEA